MKMLTDLAMISLLPVELLSKHNNFHNIDIFNQNYDISGKETFSEKWELADITQFLAWSVEFGSISNIPKEIDFWSNFKVETYIDVKHNSASFKTNFAVEVRKTHCHAGLDRELMYKYLLYRCNIYTM